MLKISILTPSYQHAEFIGRTLDSVRRQSGPFEVEHIVVDGGSRDGTVEILRARGERVRWVSEPDQGQADALNKALAMAGGDVIGWLNSDDVYAPGALATVAEIFAAEADTQWLYGKVRIIDAADREIRRWITRHKNRRMRRYRYDDLLAANWISQMGVFWRRSAAEQIGPFRDDLRYCMDYDYWLRLGARWPGRFVDEYLACFRWYPASKSGAGFREQFREELAVAEQIAAGRFGRAIRRHRAHCAKVVAAYTLLRLLGR